MAPPMQAACEGCGKSWNVPAAGKVYRCKECGGRVAAPAPTTVARTPAIEAPSTAKRLAASRRPARSRAQFVILGAVVLVIVGLGVAFAFLGQPQTIQERAEQFQEAWERGRFEAIQTYFTKEVLDRAEDKLEHDGKRMRQLFEERGWLDGRPQLGTAEVVDETEGTAELHFPLAGGTFMTRWQKLGDSWRIGAFRYPLYSEKGDPPTPESCKALEEAVGRFAGAWSQGRDDDIKPMFLDYKREKWSGWLGRRGAAFERTPFGEPRYDFDTRIRVSVHLPTDRGQDFRMNWQEVDGTWVITGMRPR